MKPSSPGPLGPSGSAAAVWSSLGELPRVSLAQLPTPLERWDRLSEKLGLEMVCKRDDLSGLAFGGNKTRQFEYLLGEAVHRGCDTAVVGPYAAQSNYCRQLAAACARLGIHARLVLRAVRDSDFQVQGNLLLDHLLGATVSVHAVTPEEHRGLVARVAEEEEQAGRRVYDPESMAYLAAVAYVHAGLELFDQLDGWGIEPRVICLAAAGESQAGLVLAAEALGRSVRIVGFDPGVSWWDVRARVRQTGNEAAARLGLRTDFSTTAIENISDYSGPGYGLVSPSSLAALRLVAHSEGVLLDPVYTSKAMAGLLAMIEQEEITEGPIVFIHTGGLPALFHYRDALGLPALASSSIT